MTEPLTFAFWPESAAGPTNNCIGIANVLAERGHRVVFIAESSWKGKLDALGFEERLVDLAEPPEGPVDAGQFWKDFISETAPEFRKPTVEQLATVTKPIWEELIDGARYSQERLADILDDVAADVVVEDNVVAFPALLTCGSAFARIVSCNPLEIPDPLLPPVFSGLPTDDDAQWEDFERTYRELHRDLWEDLNQWVTEQGAPPLPDLEFIHTSDHANLYLYPQVLDYQRSLPLDHTWQRLPSSVRTTDEPFHVPEELAGGDGSLIYLSLGSLGSADVGLMQRLVAVLAETPHRFIVSRGPRHAEYELADNMWGQEVLPQTNVLPHVDLVITHGGNNTVTESVHFGKPMIVLPLFWDQYDNAQRVQESGRGLRLDTYGFEDDELRGAIDQLLGDAALRRRTDMDGRRVRAADGTAIAADRLERVAHASQP